MWIQGTGIALIPASIHHLERAIAILSPKQMAQLTCTSVLDCRQSQKAENPTTALSQKIYLSLKRLAWVEAIFSLPLHMAFTACVYSKGKNHTYAKAFSRLFTKGSHGKILECLLGNCEVYLGTRDRTQRKQERASMEITINSEIMPQHTQRHFWRTKILPRECSVSWALNDNSFQNWNTFMHHQEDLVLAPCKRQLRPSFAGPHQITNSEAKVAQEKTDKLTFG